MSEVWRPIEGYEGIYEVSSYGRVRSMERDVSFYINGTLVTHPKPSVIRKTKMERKGYLRLNLCKDGVKKFYSVHRLVAKAFIPNPHNLPQVNHKDENKLNNHVDNLEWCTCEENAKYGTRNERIYRNGGGSRHKAIGKYDEHGKLIATYESIRKAAIANKVSPSAVSLSAHKIPKAERVFGYFYRFLDNETKH